MSWAGLLAHSTALAKASLALPRDAEGDRWRAAVPAIVSLQAVTHALAEIDALDRCGPPGERALALDKAEMLIRRDSMTLETLWLPSPVHDALAGLIADARGALASASDPDYQWTVRSESLIADHPAAVVRILLGAGFAGDLHLPAPGIVLFRACPAAWMRFAWAPTHDHTPSNPSEATVRTLVVQAISGHLEAGGGAVSLTRVSRGGLPFRQFDFARGGPVRDLVIEPGRPAPPGQPLLVPAILGGIEQPVSLPPRKISVIDPLPVVWARDEAGK